jgi:hypothetical protein
MGVIRIRFFPWDFPSGKQVENIGKLQDKP